MRALAVWFRGETFFCHLVRRIGGRGAWRYLRTIRQAACKDGVVPYVLRASSVSHPLWCRPGTSDRAIFSQVFIEQQYALEDLDPTEVGFVVDCGANVGYSTAWFASRYPRCKVLAIEADPSNCRLLDRNVAAYGSRVETVKAGVWSCNLPLKLVVGQYGWESSVRPVEPGESGDMQGIDMPAILQRSPTGRIDILKMDIEGAERIVFGSANVATWLEYVGVIMVEIHGEEAQRAFRAAVLPRGFMLTQQGETVVARRASDVRKASGRGYTGAPNPPCSWDRSCSMPERS